MFDVYWAEDLIERVETQIKLGHFDNLLKEKPMNGIELIAKERNKQLTELGRTIESDKQYNSEFQLTDAATALVINVPEEMQEAYLQGQGNYAPVGWNIDSWKKMIAQPYKERLIIAGALIAAELDRIS